MHKYYYLFWTFYTVRYCLSWIFYTVCYVFLEHPILFTIVFRQHSMLLYCLLLSFVNILYCSLLLFRILFATIITSSSFLNQNHCKLKVEFRSAEIYNGIHDTSVRTNGLIFMRSIVHPIGSAVEPLPGKNSFIQFYKKQKPVMAVTFISNLIWDYQRHGSYRVKVFISSKFKQTRSLAEFLMQSISRKIGRKVFYFLLTLTLQLNIFYLGI